MCGDIVPGQTPELAGARLGLEMEMVVANARSGASARVQKYFSALARIKAQRHIDSQEIHLADECTAILTRDAECGLDNGFNLLETALAPVEGGCGGLDRLAVVAHRELDDSLRALREEGLLVLNAAQHPDCSRDLKFYVEMRVPRPIYTELVDYRGWQHHEGIDAKAQNGVNTAVPVNQAARALNALIGLAPAAIALFANSPLESGRVTGLKETRLTLWPRVFGPARFPGDAMLQRFPERPFHDLSDYFHWMFGAGTVSRSLPFDTAVHYKTADTALLDGDPCLYDFLHAERWPARGLADGAPVVVQPDATHFVYSQIAVFLDARFRYQLQRMPDLSSLLKAWKTEGGLEALFSDCGIDGYIEGRAPGANFADQALLDEAGVDVARSVLMAPAALQLGLMRNLEMALDLVRDQGWAVLGQLREAAMRQGVHDNKVQRLCRDVLEVARGGLVAAERDWLGYAEYVVQTGRCGATRLLETWNPETDEDVGQRLRRIVRRHAALPPDRYTPPRATDSGRAEADQ